MTNKHDHTECEHELKYCKLCDVAYCVKCNKEWKYYTQYFNQPFTVTYTDGNGLPGAVPPLNTECHNTHDQC